MKILRNLVLAIMAFVSLASFGQAKNLPLW